MELDLNDGVNPLNNLITQVIFEKNLMTKLEVTDTIINSLDDKTRKVTKAREFQKYLHNLFGDEEFMKRMTYISTLKENIELAVEYGGVDYISSGDYTYDIGYEKRVLLIKKDLSVFLGSLLKQISKGVELEL